MMIGLMKVGGLPSCLSRLKRLTSQQQLVAQDSWHSSAYRIQGDSLKMHLSALTNSNLQKCYVRDYTVTAIS